MAANQQDEWESKIKSECPSINELPSRFSSWESFNRSLELYRNTIESKFALPDSIVFSILPHDLGNEGGDHFFEEVIAGLGSNDDGDPIDFSQFATTTFDPLPLLENTQQYRFSLVKPGGTIKRVCFVVKKGEHPRTFPSTKAIGVIKSGEIQPYSSVTDYAVVCVEI